MLTTQCFRRSGLVNLTWLDPTRPARFDPKREQSKGSSAVGWITVTRMDSTRPDPTRPASFDPNREQPWNLSAV